MPDIKTIDSEIDDHYSLLEYIATWFKDYQESLKKKDEEFTEEITKQSPEWSKERRVEFLQTKEKELNDEYVKIYDLAYETTATHPKDDQYWFVELVADEIKKPLRGITKEIKKIKFELGAWNNPKLLTESNGVTEAEIDYARNVDWESVVPDSEPSAGGRRTTICLWHNDSNPSLILYPDSRGGFCFVCNKNIDTIEYFIKKYNVNFVEAVRSLNKL
jgi:hypothetical protein